MQVHRTALYIWHSICGDGLGGRRWAVKSTHACADTPSHISVLGRQGRYKRAMASLTRMSYTTASQTQSAVRRTMPRPTWEPDLEAVEVATGRSPLGNANASDVFRSALHPPVWHVHAASEDRTHDLRIMGPTRCQLRYRRSCMIHDPIWVSIQRTLMEIVALPVAHSIMPKRGFR